MYDIPKGIKRDVKLWAFYLLDIGIIGGLLIAAVYVNKALALSGVMQIVFYIATGVFGVFLCGRTKSHPTDRNASMLLYILRMDRNRYHPIETRAKGVWSR